jgi:hypothetical protein
LLLSRHTKRNFGVVARIAMWIVGIEVLYVFWLINPAFHHDAFQIHWTHVTAFVGVGGLWISLFLRYLKQLPILPPNDHRIPSSKHSSMIMGMAIRHLPATNRHRLSLLPHYGTPWWGFCV